MKPKKSWVTPGVPSGLSAVLRLAGAALGSTLLLGQGRDWVGCLSGSLFSRGLSSVWFFMPAPSWSPAHSKQKALHTVRQRPARQLSVWKEGGGWDEGAGQIRPCEGVQSCLDGESLGRGDLTFRTASFLLPLFSHLCHGSFEGSGKGGGELSRVNSGPPGEKRSIKRQVGRRKRGPFNEREENFHTREPGPCSLRQLWPFPACYLSPCLSPQLSSLLSLLISCMLPLSSFLPSVCVSPDPTPQHHSLQLSPIPTHQY